MVMVSQLDKICTECSTRIVGQSVKSSGSMVTWQGLFGKESSIIPGYAHPECASPRMLRAMLCAKCFTIAPCAC